MAYESPDIIDYGTLADLTESSNQVNSDVPTGVPDTAFSAIGP